jgi:hypothetical protein
MVVLHSSYRTPHVEDDFARNFSVAHLKDVNQPHFNLAADREMPVSVLCHFKPDDAVIDDAGLR